MELFQLIETFQEAITRAVLRTYPPLYSARNRHQWGFDLRRLRRRPLGAQGDAIRAVALSLQRHRGTNLVGEMGTGKTTIAAAAAYLAGFRRVLVLCPPHLVRKWQREDVVIPGSTDALPKEAVCWLDVPTNKTGTSFTKAVDQIVGEGILAWEGERPTQLPLSTGPRTPARASFWRLRPICFGEGKRSRSSRRSRQQ
jgi:hypothetical protein